ncbi:MAG: hypothetical protein IT204_02765 [Fimbriimonadaceae bacterium]|nr:hypothetical protein [Fimbriimonadaceae bacterium]
MLAGAYDVQFDPAGRITVPARLRAELGEEVIVTRALPPYQHLLIFPADAFKPYLRSILPTVTTDPGQEALRRMLMMNAYPVKLDKAGRLLIAEPLRRRARLEGAARCVGMDYCLELWSQEAIEDWERAANTPEMQYRMVEALQGLGKAQMERWQAGEAA